MRDQPPPLRVGYRSGCEGCMSNPRGLGTGVSSVHCLRPVSDMLANKHSPTRPSSDDHVYDILMANPVESQCVDRTKAAWRDSPSL